MTIFALMVASSSADETTFSTPILASYTFDEGVDPAGPDTFRVFERSKGAVTRTTHFRFSGEYSVELRDVGGNGDFPELLGYFERRDAGQMFVHFAFLVVDPEQSFNLALIGGEWFRLKKDGFAFWLFSREGYLTHMSDSIPKRLMSLEAFTWYVVDLLYDIDQGTYSLLIEQEGRTQPAVALRDQPNASNQPGSAVDKFSFVSDPFDDISNVVYYVDDIVIGAGEEVELPHFVAPGRRKLFVEHDLRQQFKREESRVESTADSKPDPWLELMRRQSFDLALQTAETELTVAGHDAGWAERAGDAALLAENPMLALEFYERAWKLGHDSAVLQLKRADAHFLLGDLEAEKYLREQIYGSLEAPIETDETETQ
jgi:hypothetical protein